jgi:hypothetical protein
LTRSHIAHQGDQIGRIFAFGDNCFFGQLFKITEVAHFLVYYFPRKMLCMYILVLYHILGHILGDFRANSPGHPVAHQSHLNGEG